MAAIAEGVATHVAESSADKAMQELKYLCCYKSYVDEFDEEQRSLSERRDTVLKDIEEAKDRNENEIENEIQLWLDRTNGLIQEDTKGKKKWFGFVTNCFWQYKRGKELGGKTQRIKQLMEQSNNFPRVARSTGLPGIEFYSSPNFMHFEDRQLTYEKLKEALRDDSKFMIGLYGLGGTGKTTMAIQVGKEVKASKVFDKVTFSAVSKDPSLKKIRDNIAKYLNFSFKEGVDECEQAEQLWKRIAEGGEKVLIILDDMWEKLTFRDIGIPLGRHGKGCCSVLLTTRDRRVCGDMGCHEIIELKVLDEKGAVDLFLSSAGMSTDGSSNGFKEVALGIVNKCGRLPVAIVAVASSLKFRPLTEWEQSLVRLQNPKPPIPNVEEDLREAYNSLKLSYDNLNNEKAKELFLMFSLFPEGWEIPTEVLTRMAIGLGFCGEASRYFAARSHFTPIKNKLIDSCLLLKTEDEFVEMHDLVREVALWIGKTQVQVCMDSNTTLMEDIQYSYWNIIDNFPNHFGCRKLEVLVIWINNDERFGANIKVPYAIFKGMENLKILDLMSRLKSGISAASLFQSSCLSLINVRVLSIRNFSLGDISILVNLKSLESLELGRCSIIELPNNIAELKKLKLLEIEHCFVEKKNPFEVIGSCQQLEELYYTGNHVDKHYKQITIATLPKLQRYHIEGMSNHGVDYSISRYFDNKGLRVILSDESFKSLMVGAEVLKLDGEFYHNKGCTNIVPDILSVEDNGMRDHLTSLHLSSMHEIKCLIYTEHLQSSVAIFFKLVELELCTMDVRELCCGPYPIDFLKRLEKLHLSRCQSLEGTLLDGKLELCNLKSIHLEDCSMACLFHPSTAESLKQLQKLEIKKCFNLKCIVAETADDHNPNQKSHNSMFQKLKYLIILSCPQLEFILPMCFCEDLPLLQAMEVSNCEKLKYIFGQYPKERDLHVMGKEDILQLLEELEICGVPNFINIYAECYLPSPSTCSDEVQKSSPSAKVEDGSSSLLRDNLCCFWLKSNASTIRHPSDSMTTLLNHNQALKVSYVVDRDHGLFTPPLYPYKRLTTMVIIGLCRLQSLFTLSIASSLILLETLKVTNCDTLEHILVDEERSHDHMNVNSIFLSLRKVDVHHCTNLKYIFPAFYSKYFDHLESMSITKAENLTHLFGKFRGDHNHDVNADLNFPALKHLELADLPNMVGICAESYSMKALYLEDISLKACPQLLIETLTDLLAAGHKRQDLLRRKALSLEKDMILSNLQEAPEFKEICVEHKSYTSFQNLSKLKIQGNKKLKFIFSASSLRSQSKLRKLEVSDCEALVSIIEDEDNKKNSKTQHQVRFPELRGIIVKHCKSLKCLFPISCGKLPQLLYMNIEDAYNLGQVFRWNQGEEQELVMKDVFPKLVALRLVNPPNLHTICQGVDFHKVKIRHVRECPSISLTSANDSHYELGVLGSPFNLSFVDEDNYYIGDISCWANENEEASRVTKEDSTVNKKNHTSSNLAEESCGKESIDVQEAVREIRRSSNGSPQRIEEPTNEYSSKDTSNKMAAKISPSNTTGLTSPLPQKETSATHVEMEPGSSDITDQSAQETSTEEQIKFDQRNHQQFAEDDLMRLFQKMEEGAEMEVHIPCGPKTAALEDDSELSKALADLEGSLKMSLNEIVCSEESRLRLENALNILSSHYSEDDAPSHGLQATIHSLQQEIQTIISSSKQAYATIDTFNKLEQKKKLIIEERSKRKEAAISLLSQIQNKESLLAEVHQKEAELKEKISKFQAELDRKKKEMQVCEMELLSLKEQKKKSVSDTMGFINEFEAVKKERSQMLEENIKAEQQLQNMDVQWSSCLSNLKKTALLLGVHLQQKL